MIYINVGVIKILERESPQLPKGDTATELGLSGSWLDQRMAAETNAVTVGKGGQQEGIRGSAYLLGMTNPSSMDTATRHTWCDAKEMVSMLTNGLAIALRMGCFSANLPPSALTSAQMNLPGLRILSAFLQGEEPTA